MQSLGRLGAKLEVGKDKVSSSWQNIKDASSDKWNSTKDFVSHPVDNTKDYFKDKYRQGYDDEMARLAAKAQRDLEQERKELDEKQQQRNKTGMIAGIVAPEAGPVIAGVNSYKTNKENEKFQQKEDKKMRDLQKKEDDRMMDRMGDLRQGLRGQMWEKGPGILVLIALITYLADFFTGFTRPPNFPVMFGYGLLVILAVVMTKISSKKWIDNDMTVFLICVAAAIGYPWIIDTLRHQIPYQWIVDLLGPFLCFPPVLIYLMSKYPERTWGNRFFKMATIIIAIIVFISLMGSPSFQGIAQQGKVTVKQPMAIVQEWFSGLGDKTTGIVANTQKAFAMAVARATGQQYSGDEEDQRGILITSVKPVERNYYTSSDIYVQAKIKATNLIGEVDVTTSCYVKDGKQGVTNPKVITMINNDENVIDCDLGALPAGSHEIIVTADFIFNTDADIQYWFVDENTNPQLYESLDIPEQTSAIYTGGPVELGLPSLNQPLRVSDTNTRVGNYPFGVSLTNKWTQGKVIRGLNYTLNVPEGISLTTCNRIQQEVTQQAGRKNYVFSTNDQNIKATFDSVTCRMHVDNMNTLFAGDLVAKKTFYARAVYEYTVEAGTTINVEKDY